METMPMMMQPPAPRGRGDMQFDANVMPNAPMPMHPPNMSGDDYRRQMQEKLPFQQESGRSGPTLNVNMAGPGYPQSLEHMRAVTNTNEAEFRERVHNAARNIETKFRIEVDSCRKELRREMMYIVAGLVAVIAFLLWRTLKTSVSLVPVANS